MLEKAKPFTVKLYTRIRNVNANPTDTYICEGYGKTVKKAIDGALFIGRQIAPRDGQTWKAVLLENDSESLTAFGADPDAACEDALSMHKKAARGGGR